MFFEDLPSMVVWLIESGGAGVISYFLLSQMEKAGWLKPVSPPWKRILAALQAMVIGALAVWVGSKIGVYPQPESALVWANLMYKVGLTAAGVHQIAHGFVELPRKAGQALPTQPA